MRIKEINQLDFSSVLFDTLFGLVLYFNLDSFLEIKDPLNFIFYLFSLVILVHWWLLFKSADDAFETEVTNSVTDVVVGITEIILIEFIVLYSKVFDFTTVLTITTSLILLDLCWALIWRYIGTWRTKEKSKIKNMEHELDNTIKTDCIGLVLLGITLVISTFQSPLYTIIFFILSYLAYIYLSFRNKIIDIKFF